MPTTTRNCLLRALCLLFLAMAASATVAAQAPGASPQFSISFPKERSPQPLDGRLLLLLSTDPSAEPRTQISNIYPRTQIVFGVDVDGLQPGQAAVVGENAFARELSRAPIHVNHRTTD